MALGWLIFAQYGFERCWPVALCCHGAAPSVIVIVVVAATAVVVLISVVVIVIVVPATIAIVVVLPALSFKGWLTWWWFKSTREVPGWWSVDC